MDTNTIFREMAQYKRMIEEAQAEYDRLANECKAMMTESGIDELIGDEHKATYKEVISNRFDSTAFKKDHGDMYESYKKASSSMRFTFA